MAFCKKTLMLTNIQDVESLQKNVLGVLKIEKNIRGSYLNVSIKAKEMEDDLCLALKVDDKVKIFSGLKQNAFMFKINEELELLGNISAVIFRKVKDIISFLYAGFLGKNKINELINYIDNENKKELKKTKEAEEVLNSAQVEPKQVEKEPVLEVEEKTENVLVEQNEEVEQEKQVVLKEEKPEYNDEVIATENYYILEETPLTILKKELSSKIQGLESESEIYSFLDDIVKTKAQEKEQQEEEKQLLEETENAENLAYYKQVESQIEALFSIYPTEENLEKLLNNSRFVKIDFNDDGKYYVVGVIYEDKKPEYICYGVPDNHENGVPNELLGYAEWLPVKIDETNDGYWMMYQDTKEGKCITSKKSE